MIDFFVGYTPGREIANRKCRQSLAQFGVTTHDVPHYWVPKTNNPFARTRYLVPLIDYKYIDRKLTEKNVLKQY